MPFADGWSFLGRLAERAVLGTEEPMPKCLHFGNTFSDVVSGKFRDVDMKAEAVLVHVVGDIELLALRRLKVKQHMGLVGATERSYLYESITALGVFDSL
jgi:hypothetical protein